MLCLRAQRQVTENSLADRLDGMDPTDPDSEDLDSAAGEEGAPLALRGPGPFGPPVPMQSTGTDRKHTKWPWRWDKHLTSRTSAHLSACRVACSPLSVCDDPSDDICRTGKSQCAGDLRWPTTETEARIEVGTGASALLYDLERSPDTSQQPVTTLLISMRSPDARHKYHLSCALVIAAHALLLPLQPHCSSISCASRYSTTTLLNLRAGTAFWYTQCLHFMSIMYGLHLTGRNAAVIRMSSFGVPTRLSFMGWSARGECGFSGAHDACVLKNPFLLETSFCMFEKSFLCEAWM